MYEQLMKDARDSGDKEALRLATEAHDAYNFWESSHPKSDEYYARCARQRLRDIAVCTPISAKTPQSHRPAGSGMGQQSTAVDRAQASAMRASKAAEDARRQTGVMRHAWGVEAAKAEEAAQDAEAEKPSLSPEVREMVDRMMAEADKASTPY